MILIKINNLYDFRKNLYFLLLKKYKTKSTSLNKLLFFKKYFNKKFKLYSQTILNLNVNLLQIYNKIFLIENFKFKYQFNNYKIYIIFENIKTILRINLIDLYLSKNYCCTNVENLRVLFEQHLNQYIIIRVNTIFQFKEKLYNQFIDSLNFSKYLFNNKSSININLLLSKNIFIYFKINILINLNLLIYLFKMLLIFNYYIIFYKIKYINGKYKTN